MTVSGVALEAGHDGARAVVLGIEVGAGLIAKWRRWLAPDPQPFLVSAPAAWPDCEDEGGEVTPELADTYRLWWGVQKDSVTIWISEAQFASLARSTRAALVREQVVRRRGAVPTVRAWQDLFGTARLRDAADGHRFLWWPSLLANDAEAILTRVVSDRRLVSRHTEVEEGVWRRAQVVLPGARRLAGTFPRGSNTNCFGTVMEAAGSTGDAAFDDIRPFDEWLASACVKGGHSNDAGIVLVWRNKSGAPVHAAVTLGDGWALEKPSRDWHSPFVVATVADVMRVSRHPGERLERHRIR